MHYHRVSASPFDADSFQPVLILAGGGDFRRANTLCTIGEHKGYQNKAIADQTLLLNLVIQFSAAGKNPYVVGPAGLCDILQRAPVRTSHVPTSLDTHVGRNCLIGLEQIMDDYAALPSARAGGAYGSWRGKDLRNLSVQVSASDYYTNADLIREADAQYDEAGKPALALLYVENETKEQGLEDKGIYDIAPYHLSPGHLGWVKPIFARRLFLDRLLTAVHRFRGNISPGNAFQRFCKLLNPHELATLTTLTGQALFAEDFPSLQRDLTSVLPTLLGFLKTGKTTLARCERALTAGMLLLDARKRGAHARMLTTTRKEWMRDDDYEGQRELLLRLAGAEGLTSGASSGGSPRGGGAP